MTLKRDVKKLSSAIDDLMIEIKKELNPLLRNICERTTKLIGRIK